MDNSFFIRSSAKELKIERFHICSWDFEDNNSIIEFGFEIQSSSYDKSVDLLLDIYIPWLDDDCKVEDFYSKLKGSDNSRFIFNDSVLKTTSLDGGQNLKGVIHEFLGRNKLCILPIKLEPDKSNRRIRIKLSSGLSLDQIPSDVNIYLRFAVKPKMNSISTKKKSIGKSTIIYDIKVNEMRNVPREILEVFNSSYQCLIESCFCLHILPNRYSITFLESDHLKNVRNLEFQPFKNYLDDDRIKKDELIVVFSKKRAGTSYSFFSIFTQERIGASQFTTAIFVNILCAFLFALPSIREQIQPDQNLKQILLGISWEYYSAIGLVTILSLYLFVPRFARKVNGIIES